MGKILVKAMCKLSLPSIKYDTIFSSKDKYLEAQITTRFRIVTKFPKFVIPAGLNIEAKF